MVTGTSDTGHWLNINHRKLKTLGKLDINTTLRSSRVDECMDSFRLFRSRYIRNVQVPNNHLQRWPVDNKQVVVIPSFPIQKTRVSKRHVSPPGEMQLKLAWA